MHLVYTMCKKFLRLVQQLEYMAASTTPIARPEVMVTSFKSVAHFHHKRRRPAVHFLINIKGLLGF